MERQSLKMDGLAPLYQELAQRLPLATVVDESALSVHANDRPLSVRVAAGHEDAAPAAAAIASLLRGRAYRQMVRFSYPYRFDLVLLAMDVDRPTRLKLTAEFAFKPLTQPPCRIYAA